MQAIDNQRTPGRRYWTDHWPIRAAGLVAILLLTFAIWFTWSQVQQLHAVPNPHYKADGCITCHDVSEEMRSVDCFTCHDLRTREPLPGAAARLAKIATSCNHPIRTPSSVIGDFSTPTALCLSCHEGAKPYVAWMNFTTGEYVELDIFRAHPIGLRPTETVFPKTLPIDKSSGNINCITCHDQHGTDPRMRLMRLYHPGNGRPADFRPLCLDCHNDGWMPLSATGVIKAGQGGH